MRSVILTFLLFAGYFCLAQQFYSLDASIVLSDVKSGHLKMGNPGSEGKELKVNNRFLTLNDKPIIPVMGEVHYSRVPREQWEDVVLKMKACGINIIAAYVLWIHHEEVESEFDWTGNKDLRAFVQLCAKHNLWVYPRIGPWCHAEVRNGGTPDWILKKTNIKDRSNDPVYQHYAETWYAQVGSQLRGLMYKDGGPIIGIQLENEYRRGRGGEEHIVWLKETARKYGFDVPLYTVTGWGNASVPANEVIPLFGAYPDAPWDSHLKRNTSCNDFSFTPFRDNQNIGNESGQTQKPYVDLNNYPYLTCEMGVGIMNTDHRRLRIDQLDGFALVTVKVGSGSNLPGYYMFAGGSNPHGILTSMEENKEETGYWNTNPVISYDFQAAIRESGELHESYFEVKKLHYFLSEFGELLAPMEPVFPKTQNELQYVVRSNGQSGFLFGTNYCRHNRSVEQKGVQFDIILNEKNIQFPAKPMNITDSSVFIWPLNFEMGTAKLHYATAQALCHIGNKWIFIENAVDEPEFCFDASTVQKIESTSGEVTKKEGKYVVEKIHPSKDEMIHVLTSDGKEEVVIVLSKEEARNAWLLEDEKMKHFFISTAGLYMKNGKLRANNTSNLFEIFKLNENVSSDGIFTRYSEIVDEKNITLQIREISPFDGAEWLKSSAVDKLDSKHELYHRFFRKEFSLGNPSEIKKAELLIYPQMDCQLQINNRWVNQVISSNVLNRIDLTGYVSKGENGLMLEFPFEEGAYCFVAKLIVEYFNTDKIEIVSDQTWLVKDAYNYPSFLTGFGGFTTPNIISPPGVLIETEQQVYAIDLPNDYLAGLNNIYLKIDYNGNKGRLYFNHRLIADDFYNGAIWYTGLNRISQNLVNGKLQLEIDPLPKSARVYFDDENAKLKAQHTQLNKIVVIPEYQIDIDMNIF